MSDEAIGFVLRHEYGRLVASLLREFGAHRIATVEDGLSQAMLEATTGWRSRSQSKVSSASPSESLNSIVTKWSSAEVLLAAKGATPEMTPRRLRTVASIPTLGTFTKTVSDIRYLMKIERKRGLLVRVSSD